MAFKINKADMARINDLLDKLREQKTKVEASVERYNEAVNEEFGKMQDEVFVFQSIKEELGGVFDDIHADLLSEYDDKSERWQEGERGEITREWLEMLERAKDAAQTDLDVPAPDDLSVEGLEVADEIDAELTDEPAY